MSMSELCAKCGEMHNKMSKCGESTKKAELCQICGHKDCKCKGQTPDDVKSKDVTPKDSGAGGGVKPKKGKELGKADVPMAPAPTKAGTAPHPQSKAGSPKVGGAAVPMTKSLKLPGSPLVKTSYSNPKMMAAQASADAHQASLAAPAAIKPVAKPSPEQHAARAAQFADFTPASTFAAPAGGAVAGELELDRPAKPPVGTAGLKSPSAAVQAQPKGGVLARFSAALHGQKPQPAMKNETQEQTLAKKLGNCVMCNQKEHTGSCSK